MYDLFIFFQCDAASACERLKAAFGKNACISVIDDNRLYAEFQGGHFFMDISDSGYAFSDDELAQIPYKVSCICDITYSFNNMTSYIIDSLTDYDNSLYVDDDHDNIMNICEYKKKLLKDEIKNALTGSALIRLGNCTDMLWLHFEKMGYTYSLDVQCRWFLKHRKNIICSDIDMYTDNNDSSFFEGNFTEYEMKNSVFRVKSEKLIEEYMPLRVINAEVKDNCQIVIETEKGFLFAAVPDDNTYHELWRFFEKGNTDKPHIVAYPDKITEE